MTLRDKDIRCNFPYRWVFTTSGYVKTGHTFYIICPHSPGNLVQPLPFPQNSTERISIWFSCAWRKTATNCKDPSQHRRLTPQEGQLSPQNCSVNFRIWTETSTTTYCRWWWSQNTLQVQHCSWRRAAVKATFLKLQNVREFHHPLFSLLGTKRHHPSKNKSSISLGEWQETESPWSYHKNERLKSKSEWILKKGPLANQYTWKD